MTLTDERFDVELKKLTADHPGVVLKTRPARRRVKHAARKALRSTARVIRRGWARVRGCLGSIFAVITLNVAAFIGWGLIPGLVALAVALFTTEWLLKDKK